jgi:hypothetical protein
MKVFGRILALAAIACGAAAVYNVFGDQASLEGVARHVACARRTTKGAPVCHLQIKRLARSPFKQAYLYVSPGGGGPVAVDCVRQWVLFGEFSCAIAADKPAP